MRPSCQSAKPWPCSAAYCSDITARVFSPVLSASVALRIASTGDIASVGACGDDGVPSSDRRRLDPEGERDHRGAGENAKYPHSTTSRQPRPDG